MAVLSPLKSQNGFGVTPVRELLITASTGERLASSFSPEVVLRQQELCGANPDSFTIGKNIYQNGLQSSLDGFQIENGVLRGVLQPTRYAWGQASRLEIESRKDFSNLGQVYRDHSANMANTWLVTFVMHRGEWHLVGQIKGQGVFGAGEVHPASAAGGVSAKLIDPLVGVDRILLGNILKEALEEGSPLNALRNNARIAFALDERFQGSVVFGYAGKTELSELMSALSYRAQHQISNGKTPEADGQALYNPSLGDRLLIKIEPAITGGQVKLDNLSAIVVDPGVQDFVRLTTKSDMTPRPAFKVFTDWLGQGSNLKYLMEQAGI